MAPCTCCLGRIAHETFAWRSAFARWSAAARAPALESQLLASCLSAGRRDDLFRRPKLKRVPRQQPKSVELNRIQGPGGDVAVDVEQSLLHRVSAVGGADGGVKRFHRRARLHHETPVCGCAFEFLDEGCKRRLRLFIRAQNNAAVGVAYRRGVGNVVRRPRNRPERGKQDVLDNRWRGAANVHEGEVHNEAVVGERAGILLHDIYSAGDGANEVAVCVQQDLGQ